MNKIKEGFVLPSAAFTIQRKKIRGYVADGKAPRAGDLVYGVVAYVSEHSSLENKQGRIHQVHNGTRAVFVLGNRYAPDYYEGFVPERLFGELDLLSRSGVAGIMMNKGARVKDPTRIEIMGYACDGEGRLLNSLDFSCIQPKATVKTPKRAKLILNIGTSMNAGKSTSAAACCRALSTMGFKVRGSKITGTAGRKDILLMEDNGASRVADFSYLGYPSTYMVDRVDLIHIFDTLDLKYGNSPKNYWVVEIADGILQRETAMLLRSEELRCRIHKLVFSAHDTFGAIGGLDVLRKTFDMVPDAISGVCSSSPLGVRELEAYTEIPIFNNIRGDLNELASILL